MLEFNLFPGSHEKVTRCFIVILLTSNLARILRQQTRRYRQLPCYSAIRRRCVVISHFEAEGPIGQPSEDGRCGARPAGAELAGARMSGDHGWFVEYGDFNQGGTEYQSHSARNLDEIFPPA